LTRNGFFVILYTKDVNNSMTEPTKPKKYADVLKDAKKHAATHLDDKFKPSKGSKPKQPWPFAVGGRPVKRTTGRGG
jgi:hypothetical protein